MARIPPLDEGQLDEQQRELLAGVRVDGAPASNIFTTLVRHPGLFRRWLPLGGKLLAGKLPPRDRELLILRTAVLCRADYEWAQHTLIARSVGISEAEIEQARSGPDAGHPKDAVSVKPCLASADDVIAGRGGVHGQGSSCPYLPPPAPLASRRA